MRKILRIGLFKLDDQDFTQALSQGFFFTPFLAKTISNIIKIMSDIIFLTSDIILPKSPMVFLRLWSGIFKRLNLVAVSEQEVNIIVGIHQAILLVTVEFKLL